MMQSAAIIKLMSFRIAYEQRFQESRALPPKEYDLGAVNPGVELPGDRLYASGYLVGQSLRARSAV
jgi:hypothetical protein